MEGQEAVAGLGVLGVAVDNVVWTSIGDVLESELKIELVPQSSPAGVWVVAREGRYCGSNPEMSAHVGEIVRRDVWVSLKCGQDLTAAQGSVG